MLTQVCSPRYAYYGMLTQVCLLWYAYHGMRTVAPLLWLWLLSRRLGGEVMVGEEGDADACCEDAIELRVEHHAQQRVDGRKQARGQRTW